MIWNWYLLVILHMLRPQFNQFNLLKNKKCLVKNSFIKPNDPPGS